MNTSRGFRKAVHRNTAVEGNLQKNLENIEGERKRFIRSLREKKLNFIERKSALPKIRFSTPEVEEKEPRDSPDNFDMSELCDWKLLSKKRLSMPNEMKGLTTQNRLQLTKTGGERASTPQPTMAVDVCTVLRPHSPLTLRRRQSEILPSETKAPPLLGRQLSLPAGKNILAEIPAWKDEQYESHQTSQRVQAPFATLGTQLPHSPLLQRQQRGFSKCLSPLDITDERQSVSLPASPRARRRRAESLDSGQLKERKDVFAQLSKAEQRLRSLSVDCEKIETKIEYRRIKDHLVYSLAFS
ncbi:hypothetical protein OS493_003551 [Desmophyllum pertusum]|uniref:Uncharacterized protein n=1 Tax=Desmophyllum pertusum TaxID=174260 RepID=A0A9X0DDC7_9CNID|nr:hypothetical protein OS493_003551 [Desmophyllum pertusum]